MAPPNEPTPTPKDPSMVETQPILLPATDTEIMSPSDDPQTEAAHRVMNGEVPDSAEQEQARLNGLVELQLWLEEDPAKVLERMSAFVANVGPEAFLTLYLKGSPDARYTKDFLVKRSGLFSPEDLARLDEFAAALPPITSAEAHASPVAQQVGNVQSRERSYKETRGAEDQAAFDASLPPEDGRPADPDAPGHYAD